MYIYGGFKDQEAEYNANIYAFDLKSRTWSLFYNPQKTAGIPEARGNFGLAVLNNEVWLFGGINNKGTLNDLWKFNLATKTWQ